MKVSIIGTGYVGLVTGVCLADKGHRVVCVDNDAEKVERIRRGIPPIHEEGLGEMLQRTLGDTLEVTTDLAAAVRDTDITLIAVGTPFDGKRIDLRFIRAVSSEIGAALAGKDDYHIVTVKSTVVPGTTDEVVLPLLEESSGKRAGADFGVGMNPEFLTEGRAIFDFNNPDRIVLGGIDDRTREGMSELYDVFGGTVTILTNNKTAEMVKYASNAMLAMMISYSNELANMCADLGGVDAVEVMGSVHESQYLTLVDDDGTRRRAPITKFLMAGCGFGGSCLPKDVKALVSHGEAHGTDMPLLRAVLDVNARQPERLVGKLTKHFSSLEGVRVAILGLAFKPNTDDVRESPAFPIMRRLIKAGAVLRAYDPIANEAARAAFGDDGVEYSESLDVAVSGADAVVLVTRWNEFNKLPALLQSISPPPLMVDGRRMLDKNELDRYEGIGL